MLPGDRTVRTNDHRMTKLKNDILRQPAQFRQALRFHSKSGFAEFAQAAARLAGCARILVVGIGASYNAGLAMVHSLNRERPEATLVDASEFDSVPPLTGDTGVILLSRSGRSIELVRAAQRCAREGARTVALTNDPISPVALQVNCHIRLAVEFDHAVSIVTYSSIILIGTLFAVYRRDPAAAKAIFDPVLLACDAVEERLPRWQEVAAILPAGFAARFTYFLGRAESFASAGAGMLLWEEVAKVPAAALTTGTFRHGPQEVLRNPMNVVLWLEENANFDHDLHLIADLAKVGAHVVAIAPRPVREARESWVMPAVPRDFQAVFNCVPVQLLAESLASQLGVDGDSFIYCKYIVEKDGGLN